MDWSKSDKVFDWQSNKSYKRFNVKSCAISPNNTKAVVIKQHIKLKNFTSTPHSHRSGQFQSEFRNESISSEYDPTKYLPNRKLDIGLLTEWSLILHQLLEILRIQCCFLQYFWVCCYVYIVVELYLQNV